MRSVPETRRTTTLLLLLLLTGALSAGTLAACSAGGAAGPADSGAPVDSGTADAPPDALYGTGALDSGSDASLVDIFAPLPDAACIVSLPMDPDADPHTCAFTPADLACNVDSDCRTLALKQCSCVTPVYGVSNGNTGVCPQPTCPPPTGGCTGAGFLTQDCQLAGRLGDIAAVCIGGQCTTTLPDGSILDGSGPDATPDAASD